MPLRPLTVAFYARPVLRVARDCIGKHLVHDTPEGRVVGRIVEAEAYRGPEDRAAHSFGGRRTARTEVMFGPPGLAYVFFVYGLHHQMNLVTTAVGMPHAVLLRAVEPVEGAELMAARRGISMGRRQLTNGPGKLCQAFAIDRSANGVDLTRPPLYLCEGASPRRVARATRVGIDYAGEWTARLWRFYDPESRYVSVPAARAPAGAVPVSPRRLGSRDEASASRGALTPAGSAPLPLGARRRHRAGDAPE
jgi:DNA-3-methyladenine glycosylase